MNMAADISKHKNGLVSFTDTGLRFDVVVAESRPY